MAIGLRTATADDAGAVAALVTAAYAPYVERIGHEPRPMTDDYAQVIRDDDVTVAVEIAADANAAEGAPAESAIAGVLVFKIEEEGATVDNVAVHPARQGTGIGRTLLRLAEAKARLAGFDSVRLYTHEKMTENQELYRHLGYAEYRRQPVQGFSLVHMRKPLGG